MQHTNKSVYFAWNIVSQSNLLDQVIAKMNDIRIGKCKSVETTICHLVGKLADYCRQEKIKTWVQLEPHKD